MPGAKQQKLYLRPNQDIRLKPTSKLENLLSTMLGEGTANAGDTMELPSATPAAGGITGLPPGVTEIGGALSAAAPPITGLPPGVTPLPVTTRPQHVQTTVPSVTVVPMVVGQVGCDAPLVPGVVHL